MYDAVQAPRPAAPVVTGRVARLLNDLKQNVMGKVRCL